MTLNIRSHEENGCYITLFWEKGNNGGTYKVEAYEEIGGSYGYPFQKMAYALCDKKKAEATFRRYVKKYCKREQSQ